MFLGILTLYVHLSIPLALFLRSLSFSRVSNDRLMYLHLPLRSQLVPNQVPLLRFALSDY